jgi:hypothetical protein
MSSATSSYAQIAGRSKFLLVVGISGENSITGYIVDGLRTVTTLDPSVNSPANRSGIVEDVQAGQLLKDLGRQIVVYSLPGSPHTAVYRQVLQLANDQAEGVGSQEPFYVKVYDADGLGVGVVRTG